MNTSEGKNFFNHPIETFKMIGVYGYKNITMEMIGKTTIFVSENGAGKTTILNALRLVLENDFRTLRKIKFKSIFIKFIGFDELEIKSEPVNIETINEIKNLINKEITLESTFWNDYSINDFLKLSLETDLCDMHEGDYYSEHLVTMMYLHCPLNREDFDTFLRRIKIILSEKSLDEKVSSVIKSALKNAEIIYLPTYRRVEKNLEDKEEKDVDKKDHYFRKHFSIGKTPTKLHHDGISYGLNDVEETLREMTFEIERTSNSGYRALSAKMLDDLIRYGSNNNNITQISKALPSIEDLERFLTRVESSQQSFLNLLPKEKKQSHLIDSLRNLYKDDKIKDNRYLNYFLSQLNVVIQDTKEQEYKIEQFVQVCNKYLTSSGDSKSLRFDPSSLEVVVNDDFNLERISLNHLSSGEKQVISLMAIIHLSGDNKKIILIDEPELSLSLEWQKMILPDLNNGKNVNQVVAITHSPFIFDNNLEESATPMNISKEML